MRYNQKLWIGYSKENGVSSKVTKPNRKNWKGEHTLENRITSTTEIETLQTETVTSQKSGVNEDQTKAGCPRERTMSARAGISWV